MQMGSGLFGLMLVASQVSAVDNWDVEGAHGVLNVYGALTESACRLEMDNRYQDILMGETGTARLGKPGDQGTPVTFTLHLKDCLRTPTSIRDETTGSMTWAIGQPAVSVTFAAMADDSNPQLIKAFGISGMGLRLMTGDGRPVTLGHRNTATILTPGKNVLVYSVVPERTAAPLVVGAYHSVVDFRLNYD